MTDDAMKQIKQDCQRDEAKAHPTCFWDTLPGTLLLNGIYFCESHAICSTCLKPLQEDAVTCRCDRYGYSGHEELLWCSEKCLEAAHPDVDMEREEELPND